MGGRVGEVEVVHAAHRDDVEVQVGHLQPGDHQCHPRRFVLGLEDRTDRLGDAHQVGVQVGWCVEPVVELVERHHQGVAGLERVDAEEGDRTLVPPDEVAGELAVDDAREDGRHGPDATPGLESPVWRPSGGPSPFPS